jgi:A/G-specific adenine glycosylase
MVHDGVFPEDADALRALPGVGRYTAGALGSIVFGRRVPILDGNVERVLLRVYGNDAPPKDRATQGWAWARAEELVAAAGAPGVLNEGLMELGGDGVHAGCAAVRGVPVAWGVRGVGPGAGG